jgi:hypothetical protein
MAGIDKIYGTPQQRRELKRYIRRLRLPGYVKRGMFKRFYPVGFSPLTTFTCKMDRLLWKQPDLPWWVREALEFQYAGSPVGKGGNP